MPEGVVSITPGDIKAEKQQCPNCLTPYDAGDRLCFVCHRVLPDPTSPSAPPRATATQEPPRDEVKSESVTRHPAPGGNEESESTISDAPLSLELQWGRTKTLVTVPLS